MTCGVPYFLIHTFWWGALLRPTDHAVGLGSIRIEELARIAGGTIYWTRSKEAEADAKKAEGASYTTFLIPSPPIFTGGATCNQVRVILILQRWRKKTGCSPDVDKLWNCKGVLKVWVGCTSAAFVLACSPFSSTELIIFSWRRSAMWQDDQQGRLRWMHRQTQRVPLLLIAVSILIVYVSPVRGGFEF